jgi:hypothetical protein
MGTFSRNENGIKHKGLKFTPVYVHNALVLFAQSLLRLFESSKVSVIFNQYYLIFIILSLFFGSL